MDISTRPTTTFKLVKLSALIISIAYVFQNNVRKVPWVLYTCRAKVFDDSSTNLDDSAVLTDAVLNLERGTIRLRSLGYHITSDLNRLALWLFASLGNKDVGKILNDENVLQALEPFGFVGQ